MVNFNAINQFRIKQLQGSRLTTFITSATSLRFIALTKPCTVNPPANNGDKQNKNQHFLPHN